MHTAWQVWYIRYFDEPKGYQSGRSPKLVAPISATNFSSNIIELLQLHDKNQI